MNLIVGNHFFIDAKIGYYDVDEQAFALKHITNQRTIRKVFSFW
jgi:hypothetical protein